MSRRMFVSSDMATAAQRAKILCFALNLLLEDLNHVPVTRDLLEGKRQMITTWLNKFAPEDPAPAGAPASKMLAASDGTAPAVAYPAAPVGDNCRIGRFAHAAAQQGIATERVEAEQEAAAAAPPAAPAPRKI